MNRSWFEILDIIHSMSMWQLACKYNYTVFGTVWVRALLYLLSAHYLMFVALYVFLETVTWQVWGAFTKMTCPARFLRTCSQP